ncbi:MAG: DNA repair protein RecN [Bacteroidetes bacterium]|jgi:DNA repair protein RecN (Recombination protein N)|nr:DNA repair protein RecN [Bacteroidota bacterium]
MLKALKVDNYVLIKSLHFSPSEGFNIITGETGAGKSILIGALGLILGERADTQVVAESGLKCVIEGVFDVTNLQLKPLFDRLDLDYYDEAILRREILASGKSRAFINDTPVGLTALKEVGSKLVDIHSQHQTLQLGNQAFLFDWLDTVSGVGDLSESYKAVFSELQSAKKKLEVLQAEVDQQLTEQDYYQFLYNELEEANLESLSATDIESEFEVLQNAEEIGEVVGRSIQALQDDEDALLGRLQGVGHTLNKLSGGEALNKILERLTSVQYELEEIGSDLKSYGLGIQPDPERLTALNDLMSRLHQLQTKHKSQSILELIKIRDDLETKLSLNVGRENELEQLKEAIEARSNECTKLAHELHEKRLAQLPHIEQKANADLDYLGLINAELRLDVQSTEELSMYGLSAFQLLFASNKGSQAKPAHKVASGGELSRLMLILKSYLAKNRKLPTLIFDEIDTGVSGEIALKMGEMMSSLAGKMQIVSITHLPQIASKGNAHFYVYKQLDNEQTVTFVKELNDTERVQVLAQMLSGENPTEGALANARELLN